MRKYRALLLNNRRGVVERNVHISLKNKYIYFAVPKCANSTVKAYLQEHELKGAAVKFNPKILHDRVASPLIAPYQLPQDMLEEVLTSDEYFRFAVVRHPVTRVLSCFLDRIQNPRSTARRVVGQWLRKETLEEPVSFQEFVTAVSEHADRELEEHFQLQVHLLGHPHVRIPHIVKFEHLGDELPKLFSRLGVKTEEIENLSPANNRSATQILSMYDDKLLDIVQSRYRADMEAYGYGEIDLASLAAESSEPSASDSSALRRA